MLAAEVDDKLGWTIRCIRAVELRRPTTITRCFQAYPYLHTLIHTGRMDLQEGVHLEPLRCHAVELSCAGILRDLQSVAADDWVVDEHIQRNRRSHIQEKIRRLKPGAATATAALRKADGTVVSDPAAIAEELRSYWAQVFTRRPHDSQMLQQWLHDEIRASGNRFGGEVDWRLLREHVNKAIGQAGDLQPQLSGSGRSHEAQTGTLQPSGSTETHQREVRQTASTPRCLGTSKGFCSAVADIVEWVGHQGSFSAGCPFSLCVWLRYGHRVDEALSLL